MNMDNNEPSQGSNTEGNSGPSQGSSGTTQGSSTGEDTRKGKLPEEKPSSDDKLGRASKYASAMTRNRFITIFNKQEDMLSKELSRLTIEESKTEDEEELNSIKEQKEEIMMQMKMLRDSYLGEQEELQKSEKANPNNLNKRSLEDSSDNVKDSKKRDRDS